MISSKDTQALDKIERLLTQVAPPAKDFEVFYLTHAFASTVVANLNEFFAEEAEFNSEDNWWRAWMGLSFEESSSGTGLSQSSQPRNSSWMAFLTARLSWAAAGARGSSVPFSFERWD
jgi:hypothetical protein